MTQRQGLRESKIKTFFFFSTTYHMIINASDIINRIESSESIEIINKQRYLPRHRKQLQRIQSKTGNLYGGVNNIELKIEVKE